MIANPFALGWWENLKYILWKTPPPSIVDRLGRLKKTRTFTPLREGKNESDEENGYNLESKHYFKEPLIIRET